MPWLPRFTAPKGFRVEMAAKNPDPKDVFSLVNMTFDAKGRLLVSQEDGPVLLCTDPDKDGVLQNVRPYCSIVKNCQGMCWVGDALLLVGDGPRGAGLYRCRDAKGKDEIDEATLLLSYAKAKAPGRGEIGGMGEHGPHAVLHGPDGALYVVNGNHTWANVGNLAANSPLRRWPHGQMGPDQDQPGSTEDALLPRLNDPYGHGANILAPGGCIWRLDPDGRNPALVACGLRNVFDAAFSLNGELFTFDSDMEGDEGLPWYRPVRVYHCPPGADFVWRTGSANTPPYYIDSLPAIYDVGRGSPVGLEFYEHTAFPPKYQGAYLMADWSLGIIYAAHLKPDGATYKLDLEKFCTGAPMNVTDIGVAPDGSVYFTMGGRHTQGGVYRIVYDGGDKKEAGQDAPERLLSWPQPQAAWSRAALDKWIADQKIDLSKELFPVIGNAGRPAAERIKAMMLLADARPAAGREQPGAADPGPGRSGPRPGRLPDRRQQRPRRPSRPWPRPSRTTTPSCGGGPARRSSAATCRRRCRPCGRCSATRIAFVRTAARLCLQRSPVKDWAKHLWTEENDLIFLEGVVALCEIDQAAPFEELIFDHLHKGVPEDAEAQLQYLRTVQLASAAHAAGQAARQRPRHRPGVRGAVSDEGLARQPRAGRGADVPPPRQHAGTGRRRHGQDHPGAARRQGRPPAADPLFLLPALPHRRLDAGPDRRPWPSGTRGRATGRAAPASPATWRTSSRRRWPPTTWPPARSC